MTYNLLGLSGHTNPAIKVIRQENPDLVLMQELTPALAEAMQQALRESYPYQILDPQPGVGGMGALSRYPIKDTDERLAVDWVGIPQILRLDYDGITVTVVNFHATAYAYFPAALVNANLRLREAEAQALADYASQTPGPLIAGGDLNAADLTKPYQIIRKANLQDAWRAAGFGLGGTFPGSTEPGSSRWKIGPWYVPQWMLRIDYIFVSKHWGINSARAAQFDGVSDHRGVITELVMLEP
jgi:endonuclease/exonuclease/phosphatase (EEP) superfamily protein YafD